MRQVYKYNIPRQELSTIEIPFDSTFLHIGIQDGLIMMWIEVDPEKDKHPRSFFVIGTGWEVPPNANYVGTVFIDEFVWHVYTK
jgi:hypothetical protein